MSALKKADQQNARKFQFLENLWSKENLKINKKIFD